MREAEHGDADIVPSRQDLRQSGVGERPGSAPGLLGLSEGDQRLAAKLIGGGKHMVPFLALAIKDRQVGFDEVDHRRDPGRGVWRVDHGWLPRLGEYPGIWFRTSRAAFHVA